MCGLVFCKLRNGGFGSVIELACHLLQMLIVGNSAFISNFRKVENFYADRYFIFIFMRCNMHLAGKSIIKSIYLLRGLNN